MHISFHYGDDLRTENEHVAEEIRKSGFPLEIDIAETLERHNWEVMPSVFYYDLDDSEFKEVDLLAYKTVGSSLQDSPNYPYVVRIALVIECKKREKGIIWIFFPRPRKPDDPVYSGAGLAAVDSFQVAKISSFHELEPSLALSRELGFSLKPKLFVPLEVARKVWSAHQMDLVTARDFSCLSKGEVSLSYDTVKLTKQETKFNRNSERNQIHSALTGLAKAVDERLEKEADLLQNFLEATLDYGHLQPQLRRFYLEYFFSVLVFDGKLKARRKSMVTDTDEVLHEVPLRSRHYFHNRLVSVVSREYFNEWLAEFEKNANAVVQKIIAQRDKLDRQVELIEKNYIRTPPV